METTRVIQSAAMVLCLVLALSGICYSYPHSYYSSDEDTVEQGVREMLDNWERQGLIRTVLPDKAYLTNNNVLTTNTAGSGHEILISRKAPRSGSNSNLRLRYGKRNNLPRFDMMGMPIGADDSRVGSSSVGGGANGKSGNWKLVIPGHQ